LFLQTLQSSQIEGSLDPIIGLHEKDSETTSLEEREDEMFLDVRIEHKIHAICDDQPTIGVNNRV
jgi:hypothetical protein